MTAIVMSQNHPRQNHKKRGLMLENGDQYRHLINQMLNGYVLHEIICNDLGHPIDYRFLEVNPAFGGMIGLSPESVVGHTVLELMLETEPRLIDKYSKVALTGESILFETYHRPINRHFEVTAIGIAPCQLAVFFTDITEHKKVKEALSERERYFRSLFENAGDAIFIEDETDRILDVNIRACELLGYSREELLEMHVSDLQAIEFRGQKGTVIKNEISHHGGLPFEAVDVRKDGQRVPVEVTTVVLDEADDTVLLSIVRDITERKKDDADRERLKQAIEQSGETIVITDSQGIIQYVNPTFTQVSGYSSQEAIGQKTSILKSGKHDDTFYNGLWEKISNGNTWQGRMTNKKKDGALYTEEVSISPVIGPDKQIVNYIAVKLDISEKIRTEQDRLILEKQLVQAQKMDLVGQLAGGVAHDFNNMLSVILGYTELAMDQLGDSTQPLFAEMQIIRKAAERSADLTKQLLAFARKQTIDPEVLDLNEIVAGMLDMLNRLIGENILLTWSPSENLWPIKVDPTQIDQILANLCVNGRDAINETGKISIETGQTVFDEAYCVTRPELIPGDYVSLVVSDDGCGMDQETLNKLFEPFFTTKEIGKGTGLGLTTIYGIVKQNNGFINVDSELGHGSIFSIYFPRHKDKALQVQKEGLTEPAKRGYETILLVEDEFFVLEMTERMLVRLGYTVLTVSCPEEAIELAAKHSGTIDLLLTDVVMPKMNGRVLAKKILSHFPKIKLLFMSGYTSDIIARQGVLDEGVQFIQKPFNVKDLSVKIKEVFDRGHDDEQEKC